MQLVKAREIERKKAIAEGKMDDPLIPKRLEDAINLVGTCMDMAPRFERYRRERENNLYEWETVCVYFLKLYADICPHPGLDTWNETSGSQARCEDVRTCGRG